MAPVPPATFQVRISAYQASKCGYYVMGSDGASFGDVSGALADLAAWTVGKNLGQTCTVPGGSDDDDPLTRTFCVDVQTAKNGDHLLTLWNEAPTMAGKLASVKLGSPVGAPVVHVQNAPTGATPGFPTYFWIIPESRLILALRIPGSMNQGVTRMERYLREFLRHFSATHVVHAPPGDGKVTVVGYRAAPGSPVTPKVHPRFNVVPLLDPENVQFLRDNRESIERVIGAKTLQVTLNEQRDLLRKLLELTGMEPKKEPTQPVPVEVNLTLNPTKDQLEEIIKSAAKSADDDGIAFYLGGDIQRKISLRDIKFRRKYPVTLESVTGILSASELLAQLQARRTSIISAFAPQGTS